MTRCALGFLLALALFFPATALGSPLFSYRGVVPCRDDIKAIARVLVPYSRYEDVFLFDEYEWRYPSNRGYKSILAIDEGRITEIYLRFKIPLTERQMIQKFGRPSAKGEHKSAPFYCYYPGGRKPKRGVYMSLPFRDGRAVQINILC